MFSRRNFNLKSVYEKIGLMRFLNKMNPITPMGIKFLKSLKFITDKVELEYELNKIEVLKQCIDKNYTFYQRYLESFKDIFKTLISLSNGTILDDIELFEIKIFSLDCHKIHNKIELPEFLKLEDLSGVIQLLDPEKLNIRSFYIYDIYSENLKNMRKRKKDLLNKDDKKEINSEELNKVAIEIEKEEMLIRKKLCSELKNFAKTLLDNFRKITELDFLIAKLDFVEKYNLKKPDLSKDTIEYKGFFNPLIKENLIYCGKEFQPVNILLKRGVTVITGANMSGKTVSLQSLALSQCLLQLGFYVPAELGKMVLVDKIFLISGDYQSQEQNLSSFAAEMLEINSALQECRKRDKILILLDEPANGTNPKEGTAIVKALIRCFVKMNSFVIISTHYDGITSEKNIRSYRVKGLVEETDDKISINNIEEYIDYSLMEIKNEKTVPHEALRISKLLGIDEELIKIANNILQTKETDYEQ